MQLALACLQNVLGSDLKADDVEVRRMAVDLLAEEINDHLGEVKRWLKDNALRVETTLNQATPEFKLMESEELLVHQKMFNISFEERDQVLRPLAESAQEAVGSMGDDTPMAVLSRERVLSCGRAPWPKATASAEAPASPTCIPMIAR